MTADDAPPPAAADRASVGRTVDAVWRIESPRLIAGLTRIVHDIGVAEELAQDALVAALEQWPREGVPRNPGAWLMTTARRRAVDRIRRNETFARKLRLLGHELAEAQEGPAGPEEIEDDLLRLVFVACHPVLPREGRVALTLRLLGGLTTDEIARAFLVAEPTVAQRIVRAKRTLARERVPFEVPSGDALGERLASVLEVVYLIFNEGYAATAGDDWMRPGLCEDALRLARVLAGLLPREPEVHGLAALLEIQASRAAARQAPVPVPLPEQDRGRWDMLLIRRGFAALARADAAARVRGPGRVRTPCRRRSRRATPVRCRRRRRTGRRSRRFTGRSRCGLPRRWSSSTGRWPSGWPGGPRPGSPWSTRWRRRGRSTATTCFRRCGGICWRGWGGGGGSRRVPASGGADAERGGAGFSFGPSGYLRCVTCGA